MTGDLFGAWFELAWRYAERADRQREKGNQAPPGSRRRGHRERERLYQEACAEAVGFARDVQRSGDNTPARKVNLYSSALTFGRKWADEFMVRHGLWERRVAA